MIELIIFIIIQVIVTISVFKIVTERSKYIFYNLSPLVFALLMIVFPVFEILISNLFRSSDSIKCGNASLGMMMFYWIIGTPIVYFLQKYLTRIYYKGNPKPHTLSFQKSFRANSDAIFNLLKDGTVFKLTGADEIAFSFAEEGLFCFTFHNSGKIFGTFISISPSQIIMDWNVEGFQRPDETHTLLTITLREEEGKCHLSLSHTHIIYEEAATAKEKAWGKILEDLKGMIM